MTIEHVRAGMVFGGIALMAIGAGMAWPPAGFLVAGAFSFALGAVGSLRAGGKGGDS